jgi:sulfate permease, SulP family
MAEVSNRYSPTLEHGGSEAKHPEWLSRYLPIISWLPSYQRSWLRFDVIAGVTMWAVLVPEAVAYSGLAGMPPQAGLFAAPFLLLGYALFGTSRQLIVGATASSAIMLAGVVAPLAKGDPGTYASLMAGLTLMIGLVLFLLGLARMGFVKNFLAEPVLTGFIFGLAMVITIDQLPKLFGIPAGSGDFFQKLWHVINHLGSTNVWALLVGVLSLALLFALKRFLPRVPAPLVAVVFGILVVALFELNKKGVAIVGYIPAGLPLPRWPPLGLDHYLDLLFGGLGVVLVLYAEHVSIGQKIADRHRYDIDPNQELIALGISNLLAGLFQGFAGAGEASKSTVNDGARARTQLAGLVSLVLVIVTLLVLTPFFYDLPQATLGAIVIYAVWGLLDVGEMHRYWRLSRIDFALALAALLGVLILNILPGLLLGVILSLLLLLYYASRPRGSILGKVPGKAAYGDIVQHPENETIPGLLIFRLNAAMFFVNNEPMRHRIEELVDETEPKPRALLLDMGANHRFDISGADMLAGLKDELRAEGVGLLLADVRDPVRDFLKRSKIEQIIGEEHFYTSIHEAVEAFQNQEVR